jgi:rod shape-determining protein MreC
MQNFLRFISKIGPFLLFVLLEGMGLYWLFTENNFQQSVFFTSANQLSGQLYQWEESVSGYFLLRKSNESLLIENNALLEQVSMLKSELDLLTDTNGIALLNSSPNNFELIPAKVIHNSVTRLHNTITLLGGRLEGIEPEMGVANAEGIVGVVSHVSDHYSVVIPVLCPPNRFSCKLKRSNTAGSLVWDGEDRRFALMEEVPPYVSVSKGDTVVTSGFSSIFPEGLMVGTIETYDVGDDANFLKLKVRLAVHFDALSNVRVIKFNGRDEYNQLNEEAGQ